MKIMLALCVLLFGCAKPNPIYITEYKEVAVPQVCDAVLPARPAKQEDLKSTFAGLLRYIENLEATVIYCNGGKKDVQGQD